MLIAAQIFALLAAVLHVGIFWAESFAWTTPATRAAFGTSVEDARATQSLAYNQGFYNLFLALMALAGVVAMWAGQHTVGATLVLAGTGAMLAAAAVLATTGRRYRRAAAVQGTLPALAVVLMIVGLV